MVDGNNRTFCASSITTAAPILSLTQVYDETLSPSISKYLASIIKSLSE